MTISRCSKVFYIILSKYFYFASRSQAAPQHSSCKQACLALHSVCTDIESRSCTASACPALSHIARYAPECRTSSYDTITQFKCKNNYEHLLNILIAAQRPSFCCKASILICCPSLIPFSKFSPTYESDIIVYFLPFLSVRIDAIPLPSLIHDSLIEPTCGLIQTILLSCNLMSKNVPFALCL